MYSQSKITIPNYYNILSRRNPDSNILNQEICLIFKKLVTNIRNYPISEILEYNPANTSMTLLFPFLRNIIVKLLLTVSPSPSIFQNIITSLDMYHFNWWKCIFDRLNELNCKDLLLWFCFHIPYYDPNYKSNKLEIIQENYIRLLDYASNNWNKNNYFTEDEFLFICNETCMPYAASYHWQNNKELLSKYCSLLRIICGSWINYVSPNVNLLTRTSFENNQHNNENNDIIKIKKRIKICFISDSIVFDSSVFRDRAAIIGKLNKNVFDVYIASFIPFDKIKHPISKKFITKLKDKLICLGDDKKSSVSSITFAREILNKAKFDIIIYPDIGMKVRPTLLAYSRIANIQINTWGHSETSGIDTIDYFITSKYFEAEPQTAFILSNSTTQTNISSSPYYTEKVIVMNSLSTYYVSPSTLFLDGVSSISIMENKEQIKTRLNFKPSDKIYGCLQTFYKISENMIDIINGILGNDYNAIIVLSNCHSYPKSLASKLITRIDAKNRIRWYPALDKDKYMDLVSICDIHLDPFPFGGCNTSYDAFDFNIPVITMPTNKINGRFTFGLYKKMDVDLGVDIVKDCVVLNDDEYIKKSVEIVNNAKLRNMIRRKIEIGKRAIFMEDASINEYESVLKNLVNYN
jgi:hypothetical protein